VLGWPVRHSRSPRMHAAAYRALGLTDWRYQLLPVPPELLAEVVPALAGTGFAGANVTIPHKRAALALAGAATPAARAIGAANTLTFTPDGAVEADNTDAPGLLAALDGAGQRVAGASALVLGAGGSARAAVWALREAGAREVAVWNRTPARARALAEALGARAVARARPADLLVNCTPIGLDPGDDPFAQLPVATAELASFACVVDLAYAPLDGVTADDTRLVAAARATGVAVVDGIEVLVRQGALSFERWTGRAAPLDAMRAGARGR
jgi:shikimate dehydrogenase